MHSVGIARSLRIGHLDLKHRSNSFTKAVTTVSARRAAATDVTAHRIRASTVDRHDGTAYSPAFADSSAGLLNHLWFILQ